jgi:uncharacterized membrane protein
MWLLFAFSGPVLWAASTHIDKFLVDRYFRDSDTAVLMIFTALIGVVMLPFIALIAPQTFSQDATSILVMTLSGLLYMGAMLFYLRAIQSEEASVIAPLFQTSAIFTLLLAYLLLGEIPGSRRIAGMALIIAAVISLAISPSGRSRPIRRQSVALMICATFVVALSNVLFAMLLRTNTSALLSINGANEFINLGGGLGVRFASMLAPVAVVSAISSTTTLFVFAFGVLLSWFAPMVAREDLSKGTLLRKGVAAAIAATGVVLAS